MMKEEEIPQASAKIFGMIDPELFNILRMGFGIFLIITSFLATQNVQSQINAGSGYIALAALYLSFAISAATGVPIVKRFGELKIFLVGGLSFAVFIAANVVTFPATLTIGACINGLGGAIFWIAQGAYMAKMTNTSNRERFTSIFVAFLAASHIASNGLTYILQHIPNFSFGTLFAVFVLISTPAAISLYFLQAAPQGLETQETSLLDAITPTFRIMATVDYLMLIPIIIAYGLNMTYIFGYFPSKIGDTVTSSLALTVFGCSYMCGMFGKSQANIVASLSGAKVASWMHGNFLFLTSTIGIVGGVFFSSLADSESIWLYFVGALFLGLTEPGFLVSIYLLFGRDYPTNLTSANSAFRFLSGAAMAIAFFLGVSITYTVMVVLVLIMQLTGITLILIRTKRRLGGVQEVRLEYGQLQEDEEDESEIDVL